MKKELLWACCVSALLGVGVLTLSGGTPAEGIPWEPLNDRIEAAISAQEGTSGSEEQGASKAEGTAGAKAAVLADPTVNESSSEHKSVESAAPQIVPEKSAAVTPAKSEVQEELSAQEEKAAVPLAPSADDGKIHINSADAARLMDLPGIGEKKAQAILDYRAQNGPFRDVTDIVKVKGIGAKMLEKMLPDLAL